MAANLKGFYIQPYTVSHSNIRISVFRSNWLYAQQEIGYKIELDEALWEY